MLNIDEIKEYTLTCYNKAKNNLQNVEMRHAIYESNAISNVIPGYNAETMNFATYKEDKFAVLFIDIRSSTNRAQLIGPEKTFLSMHAFIPAMLKVVEHHHGRVIDLMGDGIMVFFGGIASDLTKEIAIQHSGLCGMDMLKVIDKVVNPILNEDEITYDIVCGVGITYGSVIVTKIGIDSVFDVKAYGDCINQASKYSNGRGEVKVSKIIKKNWPSSKGGKIKFCGSDKEGYVVEDGR